MRFKKIFLFCLPVFLGVLLLAKPVFQSSLGLIAKRICKTKLASELSYKKVAWRQGKLIFSDLSFISSDFQLAAPQASYRPSFFSLEGHVEIEKPDLVLLSPFSLGEGETSPSLSDFTIVVREGTIDFGVEGAKARFSFEKMRPDQLGHLVLNWGDSSLVLDGEKKGESLSLKANLKRMNASFLNGFHSYPPFTGGDLSGPIALVLNGTSVENFSCNLSFDRLEFGPLEELSGSVSYRSDLGSKWEFEALGHSIPISGWGRASFVNDWLDSELAMDQGQYRLKKEAAAWAFQWSDVESPQMAVIQDIALLVAPQLAPISVDCNRLCGKGSWTFEEGEISSWEGQFAADLLEVKRGAFQLATHQIEGTFSEQKGGGIHWDRGDLLGVGLPSGQITGFLSDWKGSIGAVDLFGEGIVYPDLDLAYQIGGEWRTGVGTIPFSCSQLSKTGSDWAFDFRLLRQTWDFIRLSGTSDGEKIVLNERSHFFGSPFSQSEVSPDRIWVEMPIEWQTLLSAEPLLQGWGFPSFGTLPCRGNAHLFFLFTPEQIEWSCNSSDFYWNDLLCPLDLHGTRVGGEWVFDRMQIGDFLGSFQLREDRIEKGKAQWKEKSQGEFHGKWVCEPSQPFSCELSLPWVRFDLVDWTQGPLEGVLEGQGHFIYDQIVEADFDLTGSAFKISSVAIENKRPFHFQYTSDTGTVVHGIDFQGPLNFKVDFLKYHAAQYSLENIKAFIPGEFLTYPFLDFLDRQEALSLSGDLFIRDDFSLVTCDLKKGTIPFGGHLHQIQDLVLSWNQTFCHTQFTYSHLGHLIPITLQLDLHDKIAGALSLGAASQPLRFDWEYKKEGGLDIQRIQGSFAGIDASFFPDLPHTLVGKASIDFNVLSTFLPPEGAEVFQELKMGEGYELKGKLKLEKNVPFFKGILSGKECELFGYQLQTLFSQVDIRPDCIRLFDFKSSDKGGSMVSPEILLQSKEGAPWTVDIPTLSILDLRPSLLRKKGTALGSIRPLVVRELTMTNFKGLLDDGKTYTAQGDLFFINTFKRERTFFDLPVDFFSRIFGLDLELLIPVCGSVNFELRDGFFHLTEMTDTFSENKRSEFFFEGNPTMDLDGNLDILIKMKQYVLFKFTQPFLISIDGKLDDPQFHLRGK